jgi:hypothetical protein
MSQLQTLIFSIFAAQSLPSAPVFFAMWQLNWHKHQCSKDMHETMLGMSILITVVSKKGNDDLGVK